MERKKLEKLLESKVKIRFPDCDPFNHLNNSRYIDYMLNAREDHLIEFYDFDIYKVAKETGVSWVVSQTQIAYTESAVLMEIVTIQTSLISFSEKDLLVEAIMWNETKTKMKAVMWIWFTHFNLITKRSHKHSEMLSQFFSEIVSPVQEKVFEERLIAFRSKKEDDKIRSNH